MTTSHPFSGRIVTADDPTFEEDRQVWNAVPDRHPREIRFCADARDVTTALSDALRRGLPFSARSGGHSLPALSVVDDGMVIDVSGLDSFEINEEATEVTVGSGITLGDLYERLWEHGLTVPAGTCPKIGIGGHVLGGGMGTLSRSRGPLIDHLVRLEMIDARGEPLVVDEDSHPDLLWACRGGGGGNFGIVTSYTFRPAPIGDVTLFNIGWTFDDLGPAVMAWQEWLATADHRINPLLAMFPREQDMIATMGVFEGTVEEFSHLAEPLRAKAEPAIEAIETVPFIQAVEVIEALQGEAATAKSVRAKGSSVIIGGPLNERAIDKLRRHLTDPPSHHSEVAIYGMGGAIGARGRTDTAFVHRTELMAFEFRTDWTSPEDDDRNIAWVADLRRDMAEHTTGASYVNTIDLAVDNWLWGYYEENLPRLMEVKHRYDPENVFRHQHSIPVSLTEQEARRHGIPEEGLSMLRKNGRLIG